MSDNFTYYDFFSGGGMARLGLGRNWQCLLANDICPKKAKSYRLNFPPAKEFIESDISSLKVHDLPGYPDLAWASFPCQDLSLAGVRQGLNGHRSGTFWPFWNLMKAMADDSRSVPIIVLENVVGALTSHDGEDFKAIFEALVSEDYRVGPLVIDGVHFVPQSRPRLFIVAVKSDLYIPEKFIGEFPDGNWHPTPLKRVYNLLSDGLKQKWVNWLLPEPPHQKGRLSNLIEDEPNGVDWHTQKETKRLLSMMSETNYSKVRQMKALKKRVVGTIYKRTRLDENNVKTQRAEVRFDQISGCLRTPAGGSSRQTVIIVEGDKVRTRLLSPREAARLMGVPETYKLPDSYNEAYHLMGDGLVVPAINWLERHVLRPLVRANVLAQEIA